MLGVLFLGGWFVCCAGGAGGVCCFCVCLGFCGCADEGFSERGMNGIASGVYIVSLVTEKDKIQGKILKL